MRWCLSVLLVVAVARPFAGVGQPLAILDDSSYGHRLPGPPGLTVWWCEATYKVGRTRPLPTATSDAAQIEAARNEYEPFQLVLFSETPLSNVTLSVTDFVRQDAPPATINASNAQVCVVEYVPVTEPSDSFGVAGDYPDPLVPLTAPVHVPALLNQPFWLTVHVPKDAPAGMYAAAITIHSASGNHSVPVRLRVFDFALSDVTHTRTAYGLKLDNDWHGLLNLDQTNAVWELYLQNFRDHRIGPYMPHTYAQIKWYVLSGGRFIHDFTAFDAAMGRYLDEFNFNSFKFLDEPWTLNGQSRFSPGFNALFARLLQPIMAHLRERGWVEKAHAHWIDEPDRDLFPFIIEGMQAHLEAAPGLRRLLTLINTLDPLLHNHVDLWVPILSQSFFRPAEVAERLAHGDEVWWYTASFPIAPQPNNFIDHPALNPRIRAWMAERYGLTGELYWQTTWYRGAQGPRNPWEDPMSALPSGSKLRNGDGTLLYPPVRSPPAAPVLAGPINSLRWEILREALEDREYFWQLKNLLARTRPSLGPNHPDVREGEAAIEAALALVPSTSEYEHDPQRLYTARRRLAEAIERLDNGTPVCVRDPTSQAINSGETAILRSEFLAWPPPTYQWQLEGTNIPAATGALLCLEDVDLAHLGTYQVIASNVVGAATSAVARVAGYWRSPPQMVAQPADVIRYAGSYAVFAVTAVSANPLHYRWLFNGTALPESTATNAALLLTNLTLNRAGQYSVVVSNVAGAITSTVARLTVLVPPTGTALVSTGESWRYHDLGANLGTAWHATGFDDSAWSNGLAPLGYGDGDEQTILCAGLDEKPTTTYFRRTFQLPLAAVPELIEGRLVCDDGAVVYLNGTEVSRHNLPLGEVVYGTSALQRIEGAGESELLSFSVPRHLLRDGTNLLAVEVHQCTNATIPPLQPATYWSFDEPASPWRDSFGTNHFSIIGTDVVAVPGKIGGCASNSYSKTDHLVAVSSPELSYTGPFTIGGWFAYGVGTDLEATCLEKTNEFRLYYTGIGLNRYRFQVAGTHVQDQTSATLPGQWRFVVAWYDGTNARIQVDNGIVYSNAASAPAANANPLVALKKAGPYGGIAGDGVFVFKRVLSAAERTTLFTEGPALSGNSYTNDLSFDLELSGIRVQLPQFLAQPDSLVRRAGDSAGFSLTALSSTPVAYQWNLNASPIAGATNSLLFLSAVAPGQAGQYTLTASNLGGAVTSTPATLLVVETPRLAAEWLPDTASFRLQIPAHDVPCTLLVSTNLVDWCAQFIWPPTPSPTNWVDSAVSGASSRFYRLRLELP